MPVGDFGRHSASIPERSGAGSCMGLVALWNCPTHPCMSSADTAISSKSSCRNGNAMTSIVRSAALEICSHEGTTYSLGDPEHEIG